MNQIKKYMAVGAGAGVLALASPLAGAAEITLCAGQTTIDMGTVANPAPVTMWGFAEGGKAVDGTCAGAITVPGPAINVADTDSSLVVHLHNTLTVPVSLIIQGQPLPSAVAGAGPAGPQMNTSGRVRSLVHEVASGGVADYVFEGVKPGSHVYQSATHQQVQVQMGLYGAMVKDAAPGVAYSETFDGVVKTVPYHNAVNLFYSEVDPVMHETIATTVFDPTNLSLPAGTSTLNYKPVYALVNGAPVAASDAAISAGTTGVLAGGTDILVRMFNAGLKSHYPQSLGGRMNLVAENGFMRRYSQNRVSVPVHPLGTTDVIVRAPQAGGSIAIMDHRLALNDGTASRGMFAKLDVAAGTAALTANDDAFTVSEDVVGQALLDLAAAGVLANDIWTDATPPAIALANEPANGSAVVSGSDILYTPDANFAGIDKLTYTLVDVAGNRSNEATVTITVTPVNDGVAAADDAYIAYAGSTLTMPAPGVLFNDTDVDGDATVVANTQPTDGIAVVGSATVGSDGALTVVVPEGVAAGTVLSFTYDLSDGVNTATATVSVTVQAGVPPVAADDTLTYSRLAMNVTDPLVIDITASLLVNDTDADDGAFPAGARIVLPFSQLRVDINNVAVTETIVDAVTGAVTTRYFFDGQTQMGGSSIVLANDVDALGNVVAQTLTYTPVLNGLGTDEFLYQVIDRHGNTSNPALVRVNLVE